MVCKGVCTNTVKLTGKTVLITGANTGLGKETALEIAKREAKVVMACRNMEKGEAALNEIKSESKSENVFLLNLDLSSLESIKSFANKFLEEFPQLHILINNAGIMMCPYAKTKDGFESQIGVNHFGHFALTNLLLKRMVETEGPKRIVNVASEGHRPGKIKFDDIHSEKSYCMYSAYFQSKLANVLFTEQLHRKLSGTDITVYTLHPGFVHTELGRQTKASALIYDTVIKTFGKTAKEGAQTQIYCATEEGIEHHSGKYFADCKVTSTHNKASGNEEKAAKLWEMSEELTGVKFPL